MSSRLRPQRPQISERLHSSSSSLIDRGMEIAVPPGQLAPSSVSTKYTNKDLPPIPSDEYHQESVAGSRSREHDATQIILTPIPLYELPAEPDRPAPESRPNALSPKSTSVQPMTKSSHKILQLAGFDPRFEKTFPKEHQQAPVSPVSAASSVSVYSQPEESPNTPTNESDSFSRFSSWGSDAGAATQLKGKTNEIYLKAESYSSGERGASSNTSLSSSRKEQPSPVNKPLELVASQSRERSPMSKPSEPVASQKRERSPALNRPQESVPLQRREKAPPLNNPLGLVRPVTPERRERPPRNDLQEAAALQ
jgi:hypothetical protein